MTKTAPTHHPASSQEGGAVVAAILTGGESTRMGAPKHALRLPDGRMMIEHIRDALAIVCPAIITVGGEPVLPGVPHIHDRIAGLGPLSGLEALLSRDLSPNYLVIPCDMPLLTEPVMRALLINTEYPMTALRVAGEEWFRSLPLRISPSTLPAIRDRIERRQFSLYGLLDEIGVEVIEAPAEWAPLLANINTVEELASLIHSMQRGRAGA